MDFPSEQHLHCGISKWELKCTVQSDNLSFRSKWDGKSTIIGCPHSETKSTNIGLAYRKTSTGKPHGFLMVKYPWFPVDSFVWKKSNETSCSLSFFQGKRVYCPRVLKATEDEDARVLFYGGVPGSHAVIFDVFMWSKQEQTPP